MKYRTQLTVSLIYLSILTSVSFAGTLSNAPLFVTAPVPANVLFPLSVEYPTANTAAYQDTNGYTKANNYLGFFDHLKCYTYDTTNNWFAPTGLASSHACSNNWSGNFLNWATMTGLDEFRFAMTGGDRVQDTATLTVLQRTYQSGQGGTGNFPDKTYSGTNDTPYSSITKIVNQGQGTAMTITTTTTTRGKDTSIDTTYQVRAKVCINDSAVGGLEKNCKAYGTGSSTSYKPTGSIQNNGDNMRFGVFSYFKSNSIDNAVMRSKLKFVSPTKWSTSGSVANSNMEWSETDGTLVNNPDATEATNSYGGAVSNSGVINYINRFGTSAKGYKTYDNAGKLYYESLKYLRGLSPTTDFYNGATVGNSDSFPVITTWDDPVQYQCQKNFIMMMGDTHTHCDKRLPGGSFTTTDANQCQDNPVSDVGSLGGDSDVDVTTWTNKIGVLEGKANLATTLAQSGGASYYMAGLAYWAAQNGIRPGSNLTNHSPDSVISNNIKVKTYIIDVLENKDLGENKQYWYATKYGGADSFTSAGAPESWSTSRSFTAPYAVKTFNNTWPKTLLPAGDPASMIAAVNSAFTSIASQSLSSTTNTPSAGDLTKTNNTAANIYTVKYDPNKWTGEVESYTFSSTGTTMSEDPTWKASEKLPANWTDRKIITFNDGLNVDGSATGASNARSGVAFSSSTLTSNLSPRQQAFLNQNPASSTADGYGADRIDYIRGDRSNEETLGLQWRKRAGLIGDIVNSQIAYVQATQAFINDSDFRTYASAVNSRTPMVYVGANDGMLHAFNADANTNGSAKTDSGKEIFAYIPSAVYANLNQLSWPDYTHKYFVDASPVIADAKISTGCASSSDTYKCWRTVLVGGLNAGGQGIYALNVTDPSSFASTAASNIALWEFTDRDDPDMGYSFSKPYVRKMNNGKWAVIVGNGFNSKDSDHDVGGDNRLGSGRANLFIIFLDGPTGTGKSWTKGTDYIKIELKSPDESATTPEVNGLATVSGIDNDSNGMVDYLYAGDRRGNLWKIDVSGTTASSWKTGLGTVTAPTPLFTAKTADSTPLLQQITTSPIVSRHPQGGFLVMFGTGSYIEQSDTTSPFNTQSFYGIWDKNDGTTVIRSQLQKQATLASATDGGLLFTAESNCKPQYSSTAQDPKIATPTCPSALQPTPNGANKVDQQLGWVRDLNYSRSSTNKGERYISSVPPSLDNGLLSFVSLTTSGDPCSGGADDFLYALDYRTGGAFTRPVFLNSSFHGITIEFPGFPRGQPPISPGGVKLSTGTGTNPSSVKNQVEIDANGDPIPALSPTGGCSNFVPGRPCLKLPIKQIPGTKITVSNPPTGTVTWRQLTQ